MKMYLYECLRVHLDKCELKSGDKAQISGVFVLYDVKKTQISLVRMD